MLTIESLRSCAPDDLALHLQADELPFARGVVAADLVERLLRAVGELKHV